MPSVPTTYQYKVYDGSTYKGLLPNVTSEFEYSQNINTAGAQLNVTLGISFDQIDADEITEDLITENNESIVDEANASILVSRIYDYGAVPINLGNRVKVYEYSSYNPNGVIVFDGFIFDWTSDYKTKELKVTIVSHGARLDNYIVDPSSDIAVVQNTYNAEQELLPLLYTPSYSPDYVAQTFQLASPAIIAGIKVYMRKSSTAGVAECQLQLAAGTPVSPGSVLGAVNLLDLPNNDLTVQVQEYTFSSPITLTALTDYYFALNNSGIYALGFVDPVIQYVTPGAYSSGTMYKNINGAGWSTVSGDIAFELVSTTGSVVSIFTNSDPSDIARTALNVFNSKGGLVTYDDTSIDDTGLSVNYDFKLATVLETATKGYELAPSTWYWYVDVATNLYHLHGSASSPDHYFTLGKHVDNITISQTLSTMKNIIYFSGGDQGSGTNLFRINSDAGSVAQYGQWLERISDNRVTLNATADLASSARLGRYSTPPFNVTCTIPASVYDISTISLGDMVKFNGFNNLISTLLTQIIAVKRKHDSIELTLGLALVRNSKLIDDLQRRLIQLETVNNPSTES